MAYVLLSLSDSEKEKLVTNRLIESNLEEENPKKIIDIEAQNILLLIIFEGWQNVCLNFRS